MADFPTCFDWLMVSEDPTRACRQSVDACPEGCAGPCLAIAGINSGVFPVEYEAIAELPINQRLPSVQTFYEKNFWNRWYADLASNELAKRVFDQGVNGGDGTSVRILQASINSLAPEQVGLDGKWGPATVAAANACDQAQLVSTFISMRCAHYNSIAVADPSKKKYLAGWIVRAER